jgi:phosphocarrier protein HPr
MWPPGYSIAAPSSSQMLAILLQPAVAGRVVQRQQRRRGMEKRQVVVRNRSGIHARAAAKLVTLCARYRSRVLIFCNGRAAEGRHMIALLALCAAVGTPVLIEVSGPDEGEAVVAVTRLISDGFGER